MAPGTYVAKIHLDQENSCSQSWAFSTQDIDLRLDVFLDGSASFQLTQMAETTMGAWADSSGPSYDRRAEICRWEDLAPSLRAESTRNGAVHLAPSIARSADDADAALTIRAALSLATSKAPYACWANGPAVLLDGSPAEARQSEWVLTMHCEKRDLELPPIASQTPAGTPIQDSGNADPMRSSSALVCTLSSAAPTALSPVLQASRLPLGVSSFPLVSIHSDLYPVLHMSDDSRDATWHWDRQATPESK